MDADYDSRKAQSTPLPEDQTTPDEEVSLIQALKAKADQQSSATAEVSQNTEAPGAVDGIRLVTLPSKNRSSDEGESLGEGVVAFPPEKAPRKRTEEQIEKVRRRQETFLQKRREKKKRRVFYSRLRLMLRMVFCLLLIAALYVVVVSGVWRFSSEHYELHGNRLLKREHLARFIDPLDGKPIYEINPSRLAETIRQAVPLVDSIYIRRHLFPLGLDITVQEKSSWGVLFDTPPVPQPVAGKAKSLEGPSVSSGEQASVKVLQPPEPLFLLHWDDTMTDLAPYDVKIADIHAHMQPIALVSTKTTLKPVHIKKYRQIAEFLSTLSDQAKLLYLDVSNPAQVMAYFDGFKVKLGRADSSLMTRISRLPQIIPTIREHQARIDLVDLSWNHQIVFKKKPQESLAMDMIMETASSGSSPAQSTGRNGG